MMISIYIGYNIVKDWGKKYQTETGFVGNRWLILENRTKHAKLWKIGIFTKYLFTDFFLLNWILNYVHDKIK